jgi:exodeoxyribonuclease V alpha subunit
MGTAALCSVERDSGGLGLPHGCPVLITHNRPALGLSNGDIGVALGAGAGSAALVVAFPGIAQPIPMAQLPEHQAAFALTIHKSQGSEWQEVAIDLPRESELLDRNLLYTAITRSSGTLDLFADGEKALTAILEGGSAG